jgi:hypothetical protein
VVGSDAAEKALRALHDELVTPAGALADEVVA